jgi:hypothetical protein
MKKVLTVIARANLVQACATLKIIEEKICLRDYEIRKKTFTIRKELQKLISTLEKLEKN